MSLRNLVLVIAAAASLATVPVAAQQRPKPITVPYQMFTLPNGLTVILHEDHSVPLVSVNVWYHVGSANEKPGRTGFAHLFEHLMFEGSKNVKEGMFDTLLETSGGGNNAVARDVPEAAAAHDVAHCPARPRMSRRLRDVAIGGDSACRNSSVPLTTSFNSRSSSLCCLTSSLE